jgi:octaprenyl-diphosphate synthase
LGKQVGADMREGKMTLPIIHALQSASDKDREGILRLFQATSWSSGKFQRLVEHLTRIGSIDYTREMAVARIRRAKQSLAVFESSPQKDLLFDIADYALVRKI